MNEGERKMEEPVKTTPDQSKAAFNKQLETTAWGMFLVLLGCFMFIPETTIKKGFWSIGLGLIFLGLNAMRYANKIRMSGFTTILGVLSLVAGALQLLGVMSFEGPLLLIILGAYLLIKPWFDKRNLFGKAEQS
jgi:hypothetical protein